MKDETIELKNALNRLEAKEEAELKFVTADRKRKTGGQVKTIKRAVLQSRYYKKGRLTILDQDTGEHKSPHIRLITHFNGKKVIW